MFPDVKMCKITLMFPDPVPLSSAIWRDRSGEGTSQEGVRVNFPGLGLGPSPSSDVTVLGLSLEKPAVAILAVLPGQSRCHHSMKTWKLGFGIECALQQVPGEGTQAVATETFFIGSIKVINMNMHFCPFCLCLLAVCMRIVLVLSLNSYVNNYIVQYVDNMIQHDGCSVTLYFYLMVYQHRQHLLNIYSSFSKLVTLFTFKVVESNTVTWDILWLTLHNGPLGIELLWSIRQQQSVDLSAVGLI